MSRDQANINWRQPQPPAETIDSVSLERILFNFSDQYYNDRNVAGTNKDFAYAEGRALGI